MTCHHTLKTQLASRFQKLPTHPSQDFGKFTRRFSIVSRLDKEAQVDTPKTVSANINPDPISQKPSFRRNLNPELVYSPRLERKLVKQNNPPIGSRRRRIAIQQTQRIPFEQLPYQCFQEARKILLADRAEKIKEIESYRSRILRLREQADPAKPEKNAVRQQRINDMLRRMERLKILADINEPSVKRRFEDGLGDMNKPIYRYLADRKWREYDRKVLMQRLTQMKVVPDVLPTIDPILDIKLAFLRERAYNRNESQSGGIPSSVRPGHFKYIPTGAFVESTTSENPFLLNIQSFEHGERLITVAVVDPDVPDVVNNIFTSRCHFLASNITISPTNRIVNLSTLSGTDQRILPWIPPHAQKGSPYHRLSVFILQQRSNQPIEIASAQSSIQPHGFSLRSFASKQALKPVGAHLFRTQWDNGTAEVMQRAGLAGADVELKRVKVEPLPYKRRNPPSFR